MNILKGLKVKLRQPVAEEYICYKDVLFEIVGGSPDLIKIKGSHPVDGAVVLFVAPKQLIVSVQDRSNLK